jgi:hypothetical protein
MLHLPARTLSPSLALIAVLALAASAAEAKPRGGGTAPAPVLELAEAERLALANHPMIRGALAAAARDREMPAVEGSLADPTLELEFMGQPATTPSVGRAMSRDYTLRQMRMHPAKRRAMRDAASALADATGEGVGEARLAVVREVRGAYYMLGMAAGGGPGARADGPLRAARRSAGEVRRGDRGQSELLRIDVELSWRRTPVEARRNEEAARHAAAAAGLTGETRRGPAPRRAETGRLDGRSDSRPRRAPRPCSRARWMSAPPRPACASPRAAPTPCSASPQGSARGDDQDAGRSWPG